MTGMQQTGPAAVMSVPRMRSVVVVTPDMELRHRIRNLLSGMRWTIVEASGGAEALVQMEAVLPEAMLLDAWLPDLNPSEFAAQVTQFFPAVDVLFMDGSAASATGRSARREELIHVMRRAQEEVAPDPTDGAAWVTARATVPRPLSEFASVPMADANHASAERALHTAASVRMHLPDLIGDSPGIRELARVVRLVAPRSTTVLIQGETGSGKEVVARAVHKLSDRAAKPFATLNCAAIPEHLLEAELFGHTRGAFTGAVSSRTGRIEAAHGGTLFLDEIGEMPLPLQAKMLRFLESGEIQRIGDNEIFRVNVRIVAATHQPLKENAVSKTFRLDLYHRLAVFPVSIPPLRDRMEDLPMLVQHRLAKLGEEMPQRTIHPSAVRKLMDYDWPGNVRELGHVLERAVILTGDAPEVQADHILV